jgi:hypothetical protein
MGFFPSYVSIILRLQYVIGYCQLMVLLPLFSLQDVVAWTSSLQDMKALEFNLQNNALHPLIHK